METMVGGQDYGRSPAKCQDSQSGSKWCVHISSENQSPKEDEQEKAVEVSFGPLSGPFKKKLWVIGLFGYY